MEGGEYEEFQAAVESSSWTKKALVRVNLGGERSKWEQMVMELEQCGSGEGQVERNYKVFRTKLPELCFRLTLVLCHYLATRHHTRSIFPWQRSLQYPCALSVGIS